MKIYRDGKAIELTEEEICAIYLEAQMRNIEDDVVLKLSEDYDVDLNNEHIDIKDIALDIRSEIADNDTIWDCEQEAYHSVIKRYLEERGIEYDRA